MKKILLLFFVLSFSFTAFSQVKIGLRLAPGISFNSVSDKKNGDSLKFSKNGGGFAFSAGVNLDFFFSDNYALMTGLWYSTKTAGLTATSTSSTPYEYKQKVALQYVQLPVALKVYTNELMTNMKLNFTLGGTIDVKIAEKLKKSNYPSSFDYKSAYQPLNIGILVGTGVEYKTGGSVILFGGIYYNRGLLGQLKNNDNFKYKDNAKYGISSLNLEVGAKF